MPGAAFDHLFPREDFRFHVGIRRGDLAAFFAPTDEHAPLLAERRCWLESAPPGRYAHIREAGRPLLNALHGLASTWPGVEPCASDCRALGSALEPDFLLLAADAAGAFRLEGGALCFPTGWALEEKIGRTLEEIHGIVPGLNASLGPSIGRLLARLAPGDTWERLNWGLAATDARNLHPTLGRPRLTRDCALDEVWLRVERQALAALPGSANGGLVFAIRVETHPLRVVVDNPDAREGFARALATMPDDVARYKGLADARPRLLEFAGVEPRMNTNGHE